MTQASLPPGATFAFIRKTFEGSTAVLQRDEALQPVPVRGAQPVLLVGDEVRVDAHAVGSERLPRPADPLDVPVRVPVGGWPSGCEVELEPDLALADRRSVGAHAAHRASHRPPADLREGRRDAFYGLDEQADHVVGQDRQPVRALVVGRTSLEHALAEGLVRIDGPTSIVGALPRWFVLRKAGRPLETVRSTVR